MLWTDELPQKEGKYFFIHLSAHDFFERHEVEVFRKDIVLDGKEVSKRIATGDFTDYWTFLPIILDNMVDDVKTGNIVIDYKNEHILFKDIQHIRFENGEEYPIFELYKEKDEYNLWAEVRDGRIL